MENLSKKLPEIFTKPKDKSDAKVKRLAAKLRLGLDLNIFWNCKKQFDDNKTLEGILCEDCKSGRESQAEKLSSFMEDVSRRTATPGGPDDTPKGERKSRFRFRGKSSIAQRMREGLLKRREKTKSSGSKPGSENEPG